MTEVKYSFRPKSVKSRKSLKKRKKRNTGISATCRFNLLDSVGHLGGLRGAVLQLGTRLLEFLLHTGHLRLPRTLLPVQLLLQLTHLGHNRASLNIYKNYLDATGRYVDIIDLFGGCQKVLRRGDVVKYLSKKDNEIQSFNEPDMSLKQFPIFLELDNSSLNFWFKKSTIKHEVALF